MFFDRLSIFAGGLSGQVLNKVASWSGPCALCLAEVGRARVCEACSRALPRPASTCSRCALPLPFQSVCGHCLRRAPAFDATRCAFEYRFPVDRLVQRCKFAGDLAVGRWLGENLAGAVAHEPRPDLLVAAPLSRARLAERGFNQAVVLARIVGARHGLRLEPRAIEKVRDTRSQHGLAREERHANLRGAFRVRRRLDGANVAIVDDVMTTGATAEALARALREAGAARVVAWVLARTPEPGQ